MIAAALIGLWHTLLVALATIGLGAWLFGVYPSVPNRDTHASMGPA